MRPRPMGVSCIALLGGTLNLERGQNSHVIYVSAELGSTSLIRGPQKTLISTRAAATRERKRGLDFRSC